MRIKKSIYSITVMLVCSFLLIAFFRLKSTEYTIRYDIGYEQDDYLQIFYSDSTETFSIDDSMRIDIKAEEQTEITNDIHEAKRFYRIDFGDLKNEIVLKNVFLQSSFFKVEVNKEDIVDFDYIREIESNGNNYWIDTEGIDAQIVFDLENKIIFLEEKLFAFNEFLKYIYIFVSVLLGCLAYLFYDKFRVLILWVVDVLKNINLIINLACNDFKMKYVSSYLGVFWAFVQPIVTVTIYIFVFGYGFKSTPVSDVPFALWLTAGIVPWFFFQDAWSGATNSLIEYSYLVKKVVFKISVLPIVKIISVIFVHFFFVLLAIGLYILFGQSINIYIIQTLYYTICVIALTLGLSYITSACVVFFKDVGQIIGIILQFGMWLTPIMWKSDMFGKTIEKILMLNPMYYIVEGYRDAFYKGTWFWEKPQITTYFWGIVLIILVIGIKIFKSLEKHFADVL